MDAGYSGTPLAAKLGYKPGQRALLLEAPREYLEWLDGAPPGVEFLQPDEASPGSVGLIHLFVLSSAELRRRLPVLLSLLAERGLLWVSWPKKAVAKKHGINTDITEDIIRDIALPLGLVDVKVCSVSEVWSGLKLVRRLK